MAATPQHAARVLGLDEDATLLDLRRAHRALVLKYHPDQAQDQTAATRHMARINAAADTLTAYLTKQARKSATQSRNTRSHRATRTSAQRPEQPCAQPKPMYQRPISKSERRLARIASTSYAKVLHQISDSSQQPTLDTYVMRFQPVN